MLVHHIKPNQGVKMKFKANVKIVKSGHEENKIIEISAEDIKLMLCHKTRTEEFWDAEIYVTKLWIEE